MGLDPKQTIYGLDRYLTLLITVKSSSMNHKPESHTKQDLISASLECLQRTFHWYKILPYRAWLWQNQENQHVIFNINWVDKKKGTYWNKNIYKEFFMVQTCNTSPALLFQPFQLSALQMPWILVPPPSFQYP